MKKRKLTIQSIAAIAGIFCLIMIMISIMILHFCAMPESSNISESGSELNPSFTAPEILESLEFQEFTEIPKNSDNLEIPVFPQIALEIPEIRQQEALMIVEAELANYSDTLSVQTSRENFSGTGYLSPLRDGDSLRAAFMIPSPQHYDLTICVCADVTDSENFSVTNALLLNQQKVGEFTITERERFVRVTFPGIYLPAGQVELSIQTIDGKISLDYFEISSHTELYALNYQKQDDVSDRQASPGAKKLMQFLKQNYGKNILSGQYVSSEQNTELESIYQVTGKYPAIRFCDVYSENPEYTIQACKEWAQRGGIVGLLWNWDDPGFPLADAVPSGSIDEDGTSIHYQTDAAILTESEITQKLQSNAISPFCAQILREIDETAEILKPLAEQDIPVLWRPLQEAGGGWYWWGESGAEAYRWLWDVLYRRLTEYHGLHNLIWIWNGQNAQYLVNPSQYDIASLDVYLDPEQDFGSRYEQFLSLYHMTKGKKLLALSECGALPDVNRMFRDHAIWSFAGLWYDEYLLNETDIETEKLIHYYNSEKVITLDQIKSD